MKVGGMMKKIISILLALCLSGCTVLDFIDAYNENQTNDTYNSDYNYNYKNKETNTTEENQNQTKNGFTVKNSNESKNKNETDNNQTKNGFQLAEKENKQLKSLYLFYYDQLSSTQKAVYEDLYAFLQKPSSMYYLKKPAKTQDFFIAMTAFMYDFPEAYWLQGYRYYSDSQKRVTSITVSIPEDLETKMAQVDAIADNVVAAVANENAYNKLKYFYEWIINWTIYQSNECDQDFTSVFLLKQSVCAGYSRTFQYLCKKAGIKCTYVPGDTDEPHAWNLVELNGKYYWVDVTWGDPIYDDGTQTLNYHYFMTTDEVLFRTHYTLDGTVLLSSTDKIDVFKFPQCTDNSLSYYVQTGSYFPTYDYYGIRNYVLQKLNENPYQYFEFQIGDIASYQQALDYLFSDNYLYMTGILQEYFGYGFRYYYYYWGDTGIIGIQVY